jgi:hypothetical protein
MNIRNLLASSLFSIAVALIGCASQAQTSNALSAPPPDASAALGDRFGGGGFGGRFGGGRR